MRTLNIHATRFSYKTTKPAIKNPPDPPSNYTTENALIIFVSIEKGDSEKAVEHAVNDIISHAKTVGVNRIVIYPYAHLSNNLAPPSHATYILLTLEKRLMEKGISVHRAPFGWYKEFTLQAAGHPLSELSRTFEDRNKPYIRIGKKMEKLRKDYLNRFGFKITPVGVVIENPWSLLPPYNRGIRVCYTEEPIRDYDCDTVCTIVTIKPEKSFFWDCLNKEFSDALKYIKNMEIVREGKFVKASYSDYEAVVGVERKHGEEMLAYNVLITLIADRVIDIDMGITPVLPLKFSPIQAAIITKGKVGRTFTEKVHSMTQKTGLQRIVIDDTNKRLGEKIRKFGMLWTPIIMIIGPREEKTGTVIIRLREKNEQFIVGVNELENELKILMGVKIFRG